MTTDLWMLVASAVLHELLILAAAFPRMYANGIPWALGPRDDPGVEVPLWAQRSQRSSTNMNENLILFAILVLVVHVAGLSSPTTALGAQIYFGARVLHAVFYVLGTPVLRTLAWCASLGALVVIGSALI